MASPVATFSPAWLRTITSISTQREFAVTCFDLRIPVGRMVSPSPRLSNVVAMIFAPPTSLRTDGPAAAATDHLAVLVEEDVVVHHEQSLSLDELVQRTRLQCDDIPGTRRNIVAP